MENEKKNSKLKLKNLWKIINFTIEHIAMALTQQIFIGLIL